MKIVFISNDPVLSKACAAFLSKKHEVSCRRGALDGFAVAREVKAECLIMDAHLPGLHGLEALKWMRGDPWLVTLPTLILAEHTLKAEHARECRFWGAWDICWKDPLNLEALAGCLESIEKEAASA